MSGFNEADILVEKLRQTIADLTALVDRTKKECDEKVREKQEFETQLDEILAGKAELEKILSECSVNVCRYKVAFEEIRKRYADQIEETIAHKDFHFFLCYRSKYYGHESPRIIESHKELIDRYGYCWWGKFSKRRLPGGDYEALEPFGESISIDEESSVARFLQQKVVQRLKDGGSVYLYNYSPNPPDIRLFVCNVIDFYQGSGTIPYEEDSIVPPECCQVPDYYQKKQGNCQSCQSIDESKCKRKFLCNFWFKIDEIVEEKDVAKEFLNLKNCFTKDSINFAIPIFYPLLVTRIDDKPYFPERAKPITVPEGFVLDIASAERGHTKTEKVNSYFSEVNRYCDMTFRRIESLRGGKFPNKYGIMKAQKNDEIYVNLPSEYQGSGRPSRYVVYLDENTTQAQKIKVESMIQEFMRK